MKQAGGVTCALLALLTAAPAVAERPVPSSAQRFEAALSRGDLRTAQGLIAPGEAITEFNPTGGTPAPVPLANVTAAVSNCRSARPSASRNLREPSQTHVFLSWNCGRNAVSINLDVLGGRMTRIHAMFGGAIPVVAYSPGTVPLFSAALLAEGFLMQLVGERDFHGARRSMIATASLLDRRSGRRVSLAAIADHVEACALREVAVGDGRIVVTRWTCPTEPHAILIGLDRNDVSRVEILATGSAAQH